jgi:hypothetical protein
MIWLPVVLSEVALGALRAGSAPPARTANFWGFPCAR